MSSAIEMQARIEQLERALADVTELSSRQEQRLEEETSKRIRLSQELLLWRAVIEAFLRADGDYDLGSLVRRPWPEGLAEGEPFPEMTANEYQKLALRTLNPDVADFSHQVLNASLGLAGEAGEFADELKKALFQGHPLDEDKLKNELGDILWYTALGAEALRVSLGEVMEANIRKLEDRYKGAKFSTDQSLNREAA